MKTKLNDGDQKGAMGAIRYAQKPRNKSSNHGALEVVRPITVQADGTATVVYTPEEEMFFQGWQATTSAAEKDKAESCRVGLAIRAVAKQCWFNSRKLILTQPAYSDSSYIEGWAVYKKLGFAMEHGWVVRNGKVVDPSLPDEDLAYFSGLEFKGRNGIQEFLESPVGKKYKKKPFFYAFGWAGHKSPGFVRASEKAHEYRERLYQHRA